MDNDPQLSYRIRAKSIKKAIKQAPEYGQIDILINTVKMAIMENEENSPFPEMKKEVKRLTKTDVSDLSNDLTRILKKFLETTESNKKQTEELKNI
uniref:Uncharacterized protein n=1 Tax=Meloidogyne enterolobii TaxID=390850 RepID=A0A6V7V8R5_MELEN|nr:unnamed protein product [Meloidogyne enterolobii]